MPPPSKGYKTMMKTSEPSSSGGHSNGRAQDRGKSREVVEILDEEDGTLPRQSSAGKSSAVPMPIGLMSEKQGRCGRIYMLLLQR